MPCIALLKRGVVHFVYTMRNHNLVAALLSAGSAVPQAVRGASLRNLIAATMVSATKSAIQTSCANKNGGSDCVGAIALRAGTFWKACAIKTNTFRYSPIMAVTTYVRRHPPLR